MVTIWHHCQPIATPPSTKFTFLALAESTPSRVLLEAVPTSQGTMFHVVFTSVTITLLTSLATSLRGVEWVSAKSYCFSWYFEQIVQQLPFTRFNSMSTSYVLEC